MTVIKLNFTNGDRKCYTNVTEYSYEHAFFVFNILGSEQIAITKAIPSHNITHIQIEEQ